MNVITSTARMLAANLLILMEALCLVAYQDGGGNWTIAVGSLTMPNGRRVQKGDTITRAEALALLEVQAQKWATVIAQHITVPLTDNWWAVLVSFVHQEGVNALPDSVLADMLNAGLFDRAGRQLNGWVIETIGGVRAPSLGIMRRMEAQRLIAAGADMNAAHTQVWALGNSQLLPLYEAACADAARYRSGVVTWEVHPAVAAPVAKVPAPAPQSEADALDDQFNPPPTGA